MVLIMVTSIFPPNTGLQVQQRYKAIQQKFPLPAFVQSKRVGVRWVREGMKAVAIYEVERGKVTEALHFVYEYEAEFASIEGYSNEIETFLTVDEFPSLRER